MRRVRRFKSTLLINTLIVSLLTSSYGFSQILSPDCTGVLAQLGKASAIKVVRTELNKDATDDEKAQQDQAIQGDLGRALAVFQEREIAKKYFEQLGDIQKDISDLEKCNGSVSCILTKAKVTGLRLKRAEETIYSSWKAESRAKNLLRAQINDVVGAMADETIAQALGNNTIEAKDLKQELITRANNSLVRQSKAPGSFFTRMGRLYWQTIKLSVAHKNISSRPEVRRDLYRGLSITLANQAIAEAITSMNASIGAVNQVMSDSWVPPNTVTMGIIQTEMGGKTTEFIDKPYSDYEGFMQSLPLFVYGKNGAATDFKNKFKSFFFISYLEFPIALFFRTATQLAFHHALSGAGLAGLMVANVFSLAGIYAYLSTKLSIFDKPTMLNAFPNYLNGTRNNFERTLYETVRKDDAIPQEMTQAQFTDQLQQNYFAYQTYFKDNLSLHYDPGLAVLYRKMSAVTRKELLTREANGIFDSIMVFMIIHAANAAYLASTGMVQELIKYIR